MFILPRPCLGACCSSTPARTTTSNARTTRPSGDSIDPSANHFGASPRLIPRRISIRYSHHFFIGWFAFLLLHAKYWHWWCLPVLVPYAFDRVHRVFFRGKQRMALNHIYFWGQPRYAHRYAPGCTPRYAPRYAPRFAPRFARAGHASRRRTSAIYLGDPSRRSKSRAQASPTGRTW